MEVKIQELVDLDIIEPAQGPTPLVNLLVVVPKSQGLCTDMCGANQEIIRERHPISTVDRIMQSLNSNKVFIKLDLKWGYHKPNSQSASMESHGVN